MKLLIEFFKIINKYRLIDVSAGEDIMGRPTIEYVLNDYTHEKLRSKLNDLFGEFKYEVIKQPGSVLSQLRKDIKNARKDFLYIKIEENNYLFQTDFRRTKYSNDSSIDEEQQRKNIVEGVEINLDIKKYENEMSYNLFSQIKYDALTKLENLLDLNVSESATTPKLKTKFSVGDLSLLFRLLKDEGIVDVKNNTDLYRFLSSNFTSKSSNDISDKSIKNKFLSPDTTAIKNLDILLVNLRIQLKNIQ